MHEERRTKRATLKAWQRSRAGYYTPVEEMFKEIEDLGARRHDYSSRKSLSLQITLIAALSMKNNTFG